MEPSTSTSASMEPSLSTSDFANEVSAAALPPLTSFDFYDTLLSAAVLPPLINVDFSSVEQRDFTKKQQDFVLERQAFVNTAEQWLSALEFLISSSVRITKPLPRAKARDKCNKSYDKSSPPAGPHSGSIASPHTGETTCASGLHAEVRARELAAFSSPPDHSLQSSTASFEAVRCMIGNAAQCRGGGKRAQRTETAALRLFGFNGAAQYRGGGGTRARLYGCAASASRRRLF